MFCIVTVSTRLPQLKAFIGPSQMLLECILLHDGAKEICYVTVSICHPCMKLYIYTPVYIIT